MHEERFQIGDYWLSLEENKSPVWRATWYDADARQTRRSSLGTKDFQQAKIALAEFAVKQAQPKNVSATEMPLALLLVRYWELHAKKIASATQAKIALAIWTDFWGDATIADLTPLRQQEFACWLSNRGYKNAYVDRIISVGRSAITRAHKWGEIDKLPFIFSVSDRSDEKEPFRLSTEQMRAFLFEARFTPHLFIFSMIMLNTHCRPSAALELAPDQVKFADRIIELNPKGRKQNKKFRPIVPLTDTLARVLSDGAGPRYVLWHGQPVQSIRKTFDATVRQAGLPEEVTRYSLRHTMATELRKCSVPFWEVEGMLGHRRPGMTEKYAFLHPDYNGQSRLAIDNYFQRLDLPFLK